MPATSVSPTIDGVIGPSEYPAFAQWTEPGEDLELSLAHNDSVIFVGIRQPGTGWVGVALADDPERGANVVLASENGTAVDASDNFAANVTDEMDSEPDTALGGTSDILAVVATASAQGTSYEFAIPLDSSDSFDQRLELGAVYPLVVAFNETATALPSFLAQGDIHFLQVYVARASDNLGSISEMLMGNPSAVPALGAMAILSVTVAALGWRFLAPRKEAET